MKLTLWQIILPNKGSIALMIYWKLVKMGCFFVGLASCIRSWILEGGFVHNDMILSVWGVVHKVLYVFPKSACDGMCGGF